MSVGAVLTAAPDPVWISIKRVSAPGVVSLIGGDAGLDVEVGVARVLADDEDDVL